MRQLLIVLFILLSRQSSSLEWNADRLSPDLFPDHEDAGPSGNGLALDVLKSPEPMSHVALASGLSERDRAFVKEGEAVAMDPARGRAASEPVVRPVGALPSPVPTAAPELRDTAADLEKAVPGTGAHISGGAAEPLPLTPPGAGLAPPTTPATSLSRQAELLWHGAAVSVKPVALDVKVEVYAEPGVAQRFFRMTISERAGQERLPVLGKDVVFAVDISMSVPLDVLSKVRAALVRAEPAFNTGDRFNVVRFSEQMYRTFDRPVPPTPENLERAARSLQRVPGQVATDLFAALKELLADGPSTGTGTTRTTNVYLITDGDATAGNRDARGALTELCAAPKEHCSLFAASPGLSDANRGPLGLLARLNRGAFARCKSPDGAETLLLTLLAQFKDPVLVNLHVQLGGLQVDQVYPETLPDLYSGQPVVVHGRCAAGETMAVRVIGDGAEEGTKLLYTGNVRVTPAGGEAVARAWARGRVQHLSSLIARRGENMQHADEIERLTARYNLAEPRE